MTRALNVIGGATAVAAGLYGGYVALTYARFGHVSGQGARNPLLDELMPEYEVRERHSVSVSASAEITLPAACEISFHDSRIVIRFEILRLVKAEAERRSGSRPDISQTPSIRSDSGCRS